jgi:Ackermannviridae exonuclease
MKFDYPQLQTVPVKGLRFYETPSGKFYPSITTILGDTMPADKAEALKKWAQGIGQDKAKKITEDAAHNGTMVHLLTERFFKGEPLQQPGDSFSTGDMAGFNAIKLKLKKVEEVWGQEVSLYSDLLELAGRCDLIGVYKGKPSIIDFKTSIRIKNEKQIEDYRLQVCAYAIMHNELFGTEITDGVILMTSAGGFPQEFCLDLTKYVEPLISRVDAFYQKLYRTI